MFRDIIMECRAVIEGKGNCKCGCKGKNCGCKDGKCAKDLDERPEVGASSSGLPKRGTEGTGMYTAGTPGRTTMTGGAGSHGQSSHT